MVSTGGTRYFYEGGYWQLSLSFAPLIMIQVHKDLRQLPAFKRAVITIGTFDGVHLGHQQIIALLIKEAAAIGGETIIITFHPHPRKVVSHCKSDVKIINTLAEKIELLDKLGVDHLVVVPFNNEFANQSAEEYVEKFLVQYFNPQIIIIGYDHRFGKNRSGDYHLLEKLGEKFNYAVKEIPERLLNEVIISSTKIREALSSGNIIDANSFLGYRYFFEGIVVEGNKLGRTIGYATANIQIEDPEKLVPADGVYAVELSFEDAGTMHKGMMNIGVRPTVDGSRRTIEVNIFEFAENIYGEKMHVFIVDYLRGEIKFSGLSELQEQLAKDKISALEKLGS